MDDTSKMIREAIRAMVDAGVERDGYPYATGMLTSKLEWVLWKYLTVEELDDVLGEIESLAKHVAEEAA